MAMREKNSAITLSAFKGKPYNAEAEREQNTIGKRIAEARKDRKLTMASFSELLASYGVTVAASGIGKWEVGKTVPNAYQLIAICNALEIEDELPFFMAEYQPLLNKAGIRKVQEYRADLIASGKYRPEPRFRNAIKYISMPVSSLPVSAGTGNFLDEENFEMIDFPESSVPNGAEFGVRVSGDSMEPVYHDGQIVWVKQCDEIGIGEVGVFIYDGDGYLKAYGEQEPDESVRDDFTNSYGEVHAQPVMISFNQAYAPREVSPHAQFQIVGRVL